ncbi:lycopene cyclase domain-containing protein [Nocardioidaceae bacterium]|nr:lycopene cyclase domain-containing protein [Nocardioidaceae bacterium]
MAACLLITLPLEFFPGVRVWRAPRRLAAALLPVIAVFVVWDLIGIAREHWDFNPRYVTGLQLGPLPIEELVFFVAIPICTVLTWEAVGSILRLVGGARGRDQAPDRAEEQEGVR